MSSSILVALDLRTKEETKPQPVRDPGYRLLHAAERVTRRCSHDFSWPQSKSRLVTPLLYPAGFDSYQTCTHCGTQRFFDSISWTAGPLFVRTNDARRASIA